jgi:hypothetical protein
VELLLYITSQLLRLLLVMLLLVLLLLQVPTQRLQLHCIRLAL